MGEDFLTHTVIIIIVVILMPMFIVLSSWQGYCKTLLGSCENMSDGFYSATKAVIYCMLIYCHLSVKVWQMLGIV